MPDTNVLMHYTNFDQVKWNDLIGSPVEIRPNVMGQILMDPSTHARRSNDDDEFLTRAQYLNAFVNGELYVCSADRGVRLRASLRDLKIVKLPDALRLPAPASAPPSSFLRRHARSILDDRPKRRSGC